MKKTFLLLAFAAISLAAGLHKYYHSHCDLEINSKTGNAEAVVEMFWHDLEASVGKANNKKVKITDKDFKELSAAYLKKNLVLRDSAGKEIEFTYVGDEMKGDEIQVYLEFKGVKTFAGYTLVNSLLITEFPQQVNQVNIKESGKKRSLVYSAKNTTQKL